MSKVIVTLAETTIGEDRDDLIGKLRSAGLDVQEMKSLPTLLIVSGSTASDFPFKDHPGLEKLEDDNPRATKIEEVVTIEPLPVSGPWPKIRHIHRDNPWGRMTADKLPYQGHFASHRDGTGVDIYLVDTGIMETHVEFDGRAGNLDGWVPLHPHGTFCASCAVGETLGIAPGALTWMAAGLRNADNTGSTSDLIAAINTCLDHYRSRSDTERPAVLSMSFSSSSGSSSYRTTMNACLDAGIVCLAAAANDASWLDEHNAWPAEDENVICVGGINMDDGPYFSGSRGTNYGTQVDILAGAQQCRGADTVSDTSYRTGNGTSYATPYVAGIVACMLQDYKRLTSREQVIQVRNYLYEQATFGRYRSDPRFEPMTPAIAYLDPGTDYPPIPTLIPR